MAKDDVNEKDWLALELEDTLEEMFETEFSEPMLSPELREALRERNIDMLDNKTYYRNLLRLQSEMIKLQDWV